MRWLPAYQPADSWPTAVAGAIEISSWLWEARHIVGAVLVSLPDVSMRGSACEHAILAAAWMDYMYACIVVSITCGVAFEKALVVSVTELMCTASPGVLASTPHGGAIRLFVLVCCFVLVLRL